MISFALLIALGALAPRQAAPRDTTPYTVAIRFDVTDTTAAFERPLGASLLLRVRREGADGWVVAVVRRSSRLYQRNLLYHSRQWHGPYPADVLAWSYQRRLFPDVRVLPVFGYPYEVRVRLLDCRTAGTGAGAVFEAGTIEVGWRRAPIMRVGGA
jgi:hypothetical protein